MKNLVDLAKKKLLSGELVIFPTETVYGIGADATNDKAIKKLFKTKNRPFNNPIIAHFENLESVAIHAKFNDVSLSLANKFWPGPLTLILKKKYSSNISSFVSNNLPLIGCRVPQHPIAQKILKEFGRPIAAPSANISNKLSTTNVKYLDKKLKNVFTLDGGICDYGLESTVLNATNLQTTIFRHGSISEEEIKKIVPNITVNNKESLKPLSPGMRFKHYSPNLPLRINVKEVHINEVLLNFGSNKLKSNIFEMNLSPSGDLIEAAKNFFNFLHILDKQKCNGIAVAAIPQIGLGKAINERLKKASSK